LEIEAKLKPFIPDFIPAVGDPDAFLKVDRPDGIEELLGLHTLDEPSLYQSDPSVLDLKLRSIYKQSSAKAIVFFLPRIIIIMLQFSKYAHHIKYNFKIFII